jgi:hypothetical protein
MTSVTSPQQTDRRGTDEIPGPRGGQGVRLLVLGADPAAQELRDQAAAAGYELAQRYSARVSHVAYGTGIDPDDSRYTKIRDAGLNLLPLQKCAAELGLSADTDVDTDAGTDADDVAAAADEAVGKAVEPVDVAEPVAVVETVEVAEATEAEAEDAEDAESLEIPPLAPLSPMAPLAPLSSMADDDVLGESAAGFVPGFGVDATELPLAAAVIGIDPWTGGGEHVDLATGIAEDGAETSASPVLDSASESPSSPAASSSSAAAASPVAPHAGPRSNAGHVLLSVVWALIPFATFGLLTPVTFGYAAYRLRSRALVLTAIGYTFAVLASFVLSAARPHAATPSDAAGALLTIALAGTWLGGTLHAVSIRTRVFAR